MFLSSPLLSPASRSPTSTSCTRTLNWWPASWGPVAFSLLFPSHHETLADCGASLHVLRSFNFFPAMFAVSCVDRASVVLLWCVCLHLWCCCRSTVISLYSCTNSLRVFILSYQLPPGLDIQATSFHTLVSILPLPGTGGLGQNTNGLAVKPHRSPRRCSAPGPQRKTRVLSPSLASPRKPLCERHTFEPFMVSIFVITDWLARDLT